MSTQLKFRRGTQAANDAFTGAEAEVVVDTTNDRLVVHDATRQGGFPVPNFKDVVNNIFGKGSGVFGSNIYVVTLDYDLDSYVDGQEILLTPDSNNTGNCNININSIGSVDIKKHDGAGSYIELDANDLRAGIQTKLIYNATAGDFIAQLGGVGGSPTIQVFTASGTWTKPSGCKSIEVTVTSGGGGGGSNTGGSNGGTSSFGGYCSSTGGSGGGGYSSAPATPSSGGTATGGDVNISGGKGGDAEQGVVASGGSSYFGTAPAYGGGGHSYAGSLSTSQYGGGGGGGATAIEVINVTAVSSVSVTVGAGGSAGGSAQAGGGGVVIIKEFY